MIDAHVHLQLEPLRSQFDVLHARAQESGVKKMILVGIDLDSSKKAIELCASFPDLYPTIGVHPSDGVKNGIGELDTEQGRASFTKIITDQIALSQATQKEEGEDRSPNTPYPISNTVPVAIGETGLDYHWIDPTDIKKKKQQWDMFIFQIEQSKRFNLPLIIHSREAGEDTLQILKEYQPVRSLMHCFSYDLATAEAFLSLNDQNMIALTGIVTFPSAKPIQETAKNIPLDRILTESDCPYLAPQKYRGQQNEPSYIAEIVAKVAELKGVSFAEVDKQTELNAEKFFNLA